MVLNVKHRIFQHYTRYDQRFQHYTRYDQCAQAGGVNDHLSSRFEIEDSSNDGLVQRSA